MFAAGVEARLKVWGAEAKVFGPGQLFFVQGALSWFPVFSRSGV